MEKDMTHSQHSLNLRVPTNTDDIIDTRDLRSRIEELQGIDPRDESDEDELQKLTAFESEIRDYCPDYDYGEALIHDAYFEEYAQELASDIGAISPNMTWPCNCIDWKAAARALQEDYTSAEFDGQTYWFRQY